MPGSSELEAACSADSEDASLRPAQHLLSLRPLHLHGSTKLHELRLWHQGARSRSELLAGLRKPNPGLRPKTLPPYLLPHLQGPMSWPRRREPCQEREEAESRRPEEVTSRLGHHALPNVLYFAHLGFAGRLAMVLMGHPRAACKLAQLLPAADPQS